ncbi:methyl-accepting chemotaxis protein [Rubellicoccus peritrichatus]|uniref:Methyl-accepting chemotaxis protein n=1 Tax=Rubellicoccus peritrichatus TaxID=3080537 RepID=A0AAQ3LDC6_9BACT|nr:methyl-accepting chemotaxis protein [Puniceicoccus sp. CR14]WOO43655.1 methyl-accepting chemotaxis protein [Puniceicoccus sp. CR14]
MGLFQFKSLRSQIAVIVSVPVITTLVVISSILLYEWYQQLSDSSMTEINLTTEKVAEEIEKANLESITLPKVMALAQENGLFGKREESIRYAEQILAIHPQLTGAYFGYEPNADGQDAEFLEVAKGNDRNAADKNGRFLPYWYRDHNDDSEILLTPLVDMETSFYYQGVKNRALNVSEMENIALADELSEYYDANRSVEQLAANTVAMITEPYVYEGKLIVEQTYPIIIDGEFKGIAGVDRALTFLHDKLAELKPFKTAQFILVSRRGRVIAATMNDDWKAERVENLPMTEVILPFYKMTTNPDLQLFTDAEGKEVFYDAAKIPTGNWTLIMQVDKDEIYAPLRKHLTYMICISIFGLVITFVVLILLANSIAKRIGSAANLATQVAQGDLTAKVEVTAKDETGTLQKSIKTMIGNLNSLISQVKLSSIQLTSTATNISSNAKVQEKAVNEFEDSTNTIAVAVKEISATSRELSETMNGVTKNATETASLADAGRTELESMESVIEKLAEANTTISNKLTVINERAKNINNVVTTITTVADQTNLLSLNAAIEAEKAGQYGLGFSVVAREIRRLADQTAVATLDIDDMVKEMQSSVATGVVEMDNFTQQMKQGIDGVRQVSCQLSLIIKHVQELTSQFESVREGMNTQSVGAEQIDSAMIQLKDAAKSTSTSIGGFKQATVELQQSMQVLRKEVDKFDVDT